MHYCPSCGYNFERDPIIESGLWRLDPIQGIAYYNGVRMKLTEQQFGILYAVAAAKGVIVERGTLLNRVGSDAETNVIATQMSRIGDACRERWIKMPIETVWGKGLRWIG